MLRAMKKRGPLREEILNPPNIVTLLRIALIPVFAWLVLADSRRDAFWGAVVFGVAAGTDFLDGWLARRFNLITTFGKFIDPLADKLITMVAYVAVVYLLRLESWVVMLILGREFVINGLRTIAISEGLVIAASQGAKWKTALQLAGIAALIVHYTYEIDLLVWHGPVNFNVVGRVVTYISLGFSLWSAWEYLRDWFRGVAAARTSGDDTSHLETVPVANETSTPPAAVTPSA